MPSNLVGPPVRGSDCYGRGAFVDLLWQKLSFGHVLLAAPRRFGKTSVMYRLIDEPRYDYKLVHADLEYYTEPADLLTALVVQLAKDDLLSKIVSGLSFVPKAIWAGFRKNVEELELHKLKIKLKEQLRPAWQESGEELFSAVSNSTHKVVFTLDEFAVMIDRMARSDAHPDQAKSLLRWLRHLRQSPGSRNVRFLIAGSIGIDHVLNVLGEITAINDFEKLRLEPFPLKVASAFLDALAEAHEIDLSPASRRKMLALIGTRVPYFLQVIFSETSKAHKQDGEPITPSRIAKIYAEKILGVDCKTYFDHYYGRIRDYYPSAEERVIKCILRQLAITGSLRRDTCFQLYRERMGPNPDEELFNGTMVNLENDFYIAFNSRSGRYEFSCKLLRDWWLRHYGMEI
jgi:hypothetical protein